MHMARHHHPTQVTSPRRFRQEDRFGLTSPLSGWAGVNSFGTIFPSGLFDASLPLQPAVSSHTSCTTTIPIMCPQTTAVVWTYMFQRSTSRPSTISAHWILFLREICFVVNVFLPLSHHLLPLSCAGFGFSKEVMETLGFRR